MMEDILVDKAKLIVALTENREKHKATFEEAIVGYRADAAAALHALADDIASGADKSLSISASDVPKPEDHTGDYDEALAMLAWSEDDRVKIDHYTFRNFVEDKWDWKARFEATSSIYNNR